jgi:hypothetical protein
MNTNGHESKKGFEVGLIRVDSCSFVANRFAVLLLVFSDAH